MSHFQWGLPIWAFLFLSLGHPASAALGSSENSIEADRKSLSAAERPRVRHERFVVREFGTRSVTVREYVSIANGKVFGVVWQGRHIPSLDPLLGNYLEEYRTAFQQNQRRSGKNRVRSSRMRLQTQNLTIERGGHLGALYGRVLVTNLIPNEVVSNEIR